MKKLLLGLALLVVAAVVTVQAGPSFFETTILYKFKNGISVTGGTADFTGSTVTGISGGATLEDGSVSGADLAGASLRVTYCGQNAENGEIFLGTPVLTAAEPTLADATCDGLDSATEATADVVLSAGLVLTPKYMRCILNGTLGAAETMSYQLRDDTANVTGVTCSLAVGETVCEVETPTAASIAAGSATAVEGNQASDNSDDDSKCVVLYQVN